MSNMSNLRILYAHFIQSFLFQTGKKNEKLKLKISSTALFDSFELDLFYGAWIKQIVAVSF